MNGAVRPPLTWLLRLEGACYALAALYIYDGTGVSWWWFAALILVPDASFLGYLAGPRTGAMSYNAMHCTIGPWALLLAAKIAQSDVAFIVGLIWFAHVGFDRALGYGLKYADGFKHTHLGIIGR